MGVGEPTLIEYLLSVKGQKHLTRYMSSENPDCTQAMEISGSLGFVDETQRK
jgi:hypothetical protein